MLRALSQTGEGGSHVLKIERLKVGALPPLTFSVSDGECLAVLGPSGSGKSRLLRAIADLDPAEGYVAISGVERREMPATAWRRQVRYCTSEPGWWAPTARAHVTDPAAATRFVRLAAQLDIADRKLDQPVVELSTGERQRLALARAMADEPKVLLLDEPTGALDPASGALVEEIVRFHVLAGRIALLVSHNAGEVDRLADARLELGPATAARPERARPEPVRP